MFLEPTPTFYENKLGDGMKVSIELDGYDAEIYGVAGGTIIATSRVPRQTASGSMLTAQVRITNCRYKIVSGMNGTASILVSNESVLQRIVQRIINIILRSLKITISNIKR